MEVPIAVSHFLFADLCLNPNLSFLPFAILRLKENGFLHLS